MYFVKEIRDHKLNTSHWILGTQTFDSIQLKLTEYILSGSTSDAIKK